MQSKNARATSANAAIVAAAFMLIVSMTTLYVISHIHLVFKYGLDKVRQESLHIVQYKPRFIVSNGDVFSTPEMLFDVFTMFLSMAFVMWFVVVPMFHRATDNQKSNDPNIR